MHKYNFYSPDHPDGTISHVMFHFTKGTELETISEGENNKLKQMVVARVRCWAQKSVEFHFVEECPYDEILRKSERFKHIWDAREEHVSAATTCSHEYQLTVVSGRQGHMSPVM
jgi:hypothetical protein